MFLKCETTLNVYEHKSEMILCRVKVMPLTDNNNKDGSNPNTCRSMTADQWKDFDKELKSWLVCNETNISKIEEDLFRFCVTPNLQVKIRKSSLIVKDFLTCVNGGDHGGVDELKGGKSFSYVLDCVLEYTSMVLPKSSLTTDEYEPLPTASIYNCRSVTPLSYVPYTPSKRKRRFHSEYQVKTPGMDIVGYEAVEDTYSPKPIGASNTDIAHYNPAPIRERCASLESQMSNINEVIIETEDERLPYEEYRSIRTRLKSKVKKYKDFGEYVPQTQLIKTNIPAYRPTPIDGKVKKENEKSPKSDKEAPEEQQAKTECPEKDKSEGTKSKDSKKKEKRKLVENVIENEKENKRSSKETKSTSPKKTERSLNSSKSGEDDFDTASHKQHAQYNNKDKRKTDNSVDAVKTDKILESRKDTVKSPTKIIMENVSSGNDGLDTNTHKPKTQDKDNKKKNKDKRRPKDYEEKTKTIESLTFQKKTPKSPEEQRKVSPGSIRRSERSPSKPRRFIEEQELEGYKSRKILKSERSPFKNKDLFGTDDDDEDIALISSDSNNNGSNKHSVLQTPKSEKRNKPILTLSSSPTSSSKKKRKRQDCEQEKAGMSKWLGKKGSSHESSGSKTARSCKEKSSSSKEKSSSSKEKSSSSKEKSSSSKDKSSTKSKSSKEEKRERCKSVSPPHMAIVMPSKEELEVMRNKHKMQREENEKVKAALEKIIKPAPKEVKQLTLKDMTLNELFDSFSEYRKDLDEIFEKNRKKDHVKGNDGINHCLVIGLIDQRLQFKMLEKLSDVYNTTNNTAHATLYANALLPEWIVRIFMEKYKLSRHQAIEQIEDQDAYRSYIDGQNENSLLFED